MTKYLKLLRVNQYIKNTLIFAPLFFSFSYNKTSATINSLVAFLLFCSLASSIYIINDIFDLKSDRKHPVKKNRHNRFCYRGNFLSHSHFHWKLFLRHFSNSLANNYDISSIPCDNHRQAKRRTRIPTTKQLLTQSPLTLQQNLARCLLDNDFRHHHRKLHPIFSIT